MEEGKGIDLYAENLTSIEKKLFLFSSFFFSFVFFRIRLFEERKFDDLFFTKEFSFFISYVLDSLDETRFERISIRTLLKIQNRKVFFTFFRSVALKKRKSNIILHNLPFSLRSYVERGTKSNGSPFLLLRFKIDRKIFVHLSLILQDNGY